VSLVAGNGTSASAGNEGPAVEAGLEAPSTIGAGPDGSIYFDDHNNFRRVDPQGIIHAFAGSLNAGYSGAGGPAVDAALGQGVLGVATDSAGNVYLGDTGNSRLRKVDLTGTISTVAGNGLLGIMGDDGPAAAAALGSPVAVAVDDQGAIYVADDVDGLVRRIGTDGIITTPAGSGAASGGTGNGDCGPAPEAMLTEPSGLAVRDGRVYVLERDGQVRVVVP
jgi:hypothetical protein